MTKTTETTETAEAKDNATESNLDTRVPDLVPGEWIAVYDNEGKLTTKGKFIRSYGLHNGTIEYRSLSGEIRTTLLSHVKHLEFTTYGTLAACKAALLGRPIVIKDNSVCFDAGSDNPPPSSLYGDAPQGYDAIPEPNTQGEENPNEIVSEDAYQVGIVNTVSRDRDYGELFIVCHMFVSPDSGSTFYTDVYGDSSLSERINRLIWVDNAIESVEAGNDTYTFLDGTPLGVPVTTPVAYVSRSTVTTKGGVNV